MYEYETTITFNMSLLYITHTHTNTYADKRIVHCVRMSDVLCMHLWEWVQLYVDTYKFNIYVHI